MEAQMSFFSTWPWQCWAEKYPNDIALRMGAQTWTWQQVSDVVEDYAKGLLAQGVQRDHVIIAPVANGLALLWLLLASVRVGARFVGLNPHFTDIELGQHIQWLKPDFIWRNDDNGCAFGLPVLHLQSGINCPAVPMTWQPSRPATFTLTSGSTGTPKAVVHNVDNHLSSAFGLFTEIAFERGDQWLLSLPLFHVSGMAIVWRWLLKGAALVVPASSDWISELGSLTHASLVPTQFQRFLLHHETAGGQSSALKAVLLGGAVIPVALTQQAEKQGIACWCGYGMTEMASTVTVKRADDSSGVGKPLPLRDLQIQQGQIFVRGDTLSMGYYRNATIFPLMDDMWFPTKDLGEWRNGELFILGRADNMFISGGENIQPEEIERVLMADPVITQAFVFPVKDWEFGQRPVAVIEATVPLTDTFIEHLSIYVRSHLSRFKCPVSYHTLPVGIANSGIKVSRQRLQQWLEQISVVE